jgi:hypothetical protein
MTRVTMPEDPPWTGRYLVFSKKGWGALRANTPLPLSVSDLNELRGLNDPVSREMGCRMTLL